MYRKTLIPAVAAAIAVSTGSAALADGHEENKDIVDTAVEAGSFNTLAGGVQLVDFEVCDDSQELRVALAWIDDAGKVTLDYRPVHAYTLTDEVDYIEPKERVY